MEKIAVIGTGIMGRGIAQLAAANGLRVQLVGRTVDSAGAAIDTIRDQLAKRVLAGKMSTVEAVAIAEGIAAMDLDAFETTGRTVDFVVESVVEKLAVKQALFARLCACTRDGVTLATNTSSLSVTAIAAASGAPWRVIGMHFFNPPTVLELVEIVVGLATRPPALEDAARFAAAMKKTAINVRDVGGFVVNRVLFAMLNEACHTAMQSVASIDDIDLAMQRGLGHPIGPFALMDLIGLDTCLAILESLALEHGSKFQPAPVLRQHVAAGHLGRKTSRGFRSYPSA